jgi:hypothetical protein
MTSGRGCGWGPFPLYFVRARSRRSLPIYTHSCARAQFLSCQQTTQPFEWILTSCNPITATTTRIHRVKAVDANSGGEAGTMVRRAPAGVAAAAAPITRGGGGGGRSSMGSSSSSSSAASSPTPVPAPAPRPFHFLNAQKRLLREYAKTRLELGTRWRSSLTGIVSVRGVELEYTPSSQWTQVSRSGRISPGTAMRAGGGRKARLTVPIKSAGLAPAHRPHTPPSTDLDRPTTENLPPPPPPQHPHTKNKKHEQDELDALYLAWHLQKPSPEVLRERGPNAALLVPQQHGNWPPALPPAGAGAGATGGGGGGKKAAGRDVRASKRAAERAKKKGVTRSSRQSSAAAAGASEEEGGGGDEEDMSTVGTLGSFTASISSCFATSPGGHRLLAAHGLPLIIGASASFGAPHHHQHHAPAAEDEGEVEEDDEDPDDDAGTDAAALSSDEDGGGVPSCVDVCRHVFVSPAAGLASSSFSAPVSMGALVVV